jgi:hypothetical protein
MAPGSERRVVLDAVPGATALLGSVAALNSMPARIQMAD